MKLISLFFLSLFFLPHAHASVRIGDWLLDELGYPVHWPYEIKTPAERCANAGGRLPTAHEIAEWAARPCTQELKEECGAKGIRETQFPNVDIEDPRVQKELYAMDRLNFTEVAYGHEERPVHVFVDFYFNGEGFVPKPRQRYTPETILTSGQEYIGGRTQFVPEPDDYPYFVYNVEQGGHRSIEGGIRCAFDK